MYHTILILLLKRTEFLTRFYEPSLCLLMLGHIYVCSLLVIYKNMFPFRTGSHLKFQETSQAFF
jgi:hypothetical protein